VPQLLISLHSPSSPLSPGALGFLDKDRFQYLQIDKGSDLVNDKQLRGLSATNNKVFVTTPSSLRVYEFGGSDTGPLLSLVDEIILPEWVPDMRKAGGDLLPVHVSHVKKRIYVGCNKLASIDEFSLDGKFLCRRHLWEIAPEIFPIPDKLHRKFRYGHIRYIGEIPDGGITVTVAFVSGTEIGVIFMLDDGRKLIEGPGRPHGGIIDNNHLFMVDVNKGILKKYTLRPDSLTVEEQPVWEAIPFIAEPEYQQSVQNIRGMTVVNGQVYCGVCHFGKPARKQIPPRLVVFDSDTGAQLRNISLPAIESYPHPRVFDITALQTELDINDKNNLSIFIDGVEKSGAVVDKQQEFDPSKEKQDSTTVSTSISITQNSSNLEEDRNTYSDHKVPVKGASNYQPPVAIKLVDVSLIYRRRAHFFFSRRKHLREHREYAALSEISFNIKEGETVGIVGKNGSGKSTLAMVICGILPPDSGSLTVNGSIQLLSLGVGFNNEMTGRENVYINGALLGMTHKAIEHHLPNIEEFTELGEFMEEPVRTYSSGMKSRLGFAIATAVKPEILILDEVLATGDAAFKRKAIQRMEELRAQVKTVILISHNSNQVKKLCTRVIWLDKGKLILDGKPTDVMKEYDKYCLN